MAFLVIYTDRKHPYISVSSLMFSMCSESFSRFLQARMLLKSLVIVGIVLGLVLGVIGTSVPWLFPTIFTPDRMVIQEVRSFSLKH